MLEKLDLDLSRVHFVGILPWQEYRRVSQASSVHVHLCRPFLLSWSLLEALACGCAIVASNTPPVLEVIENNVNGALVDFFDVEAIAAQIKDVLEVNDRLPELRLKARETVLERFALKKLLPSHLTGLQLYNA